MPFALSPANIVTLLEKGKQQHFLGRINICLPAALLLGKMSAEQWFALCQPSVSLQILFCRHFLAPTTLLDSFVTWPWFSAILRLCCLDDFIICHILPFRPGVLFWFWLAGVLAAPCYPIQEIWKLCRWQMECCVLSLIMGFRLFCNRREHCQLLFPAPTSDRFKQHWLWLAGPGFFSLNGFWWQELKRKKYQLIFSTNLKCVPQLCVSLQLLWPLKLATSLF